MGWLLVDVVWILVFALLGRESHEGDTAALAVLGVAWPFLAGYAAAALVVGLRRSPRSVARGSAVWLGAVAGGMAIRTVLEGRLPETAFIVVALAFLGAGLVGWRVVAALVARRRRAVARPDEA
ncbi:MAG: DUF3054 domain-containing protein [Actinobacteria bacterium]|nr:DUF3054 domain-containing protein [Actinomycetota bacterium]